MVTPYKEELHSENILTRTFSPSTDSFEFKWHQDREDRLVLFVNENDWFYQLDNELPKKCIGSVFIKSGMWHRVIKGSTLLEVKIFRFYSTIMDF